MRFRKMMRLLITFILLLIITACSLASYNHDSTINGTIEEMKTKEKLLFDEKTLLIRGIGIENKDGSIYEIPVDSFKDYKVGQKVEIDVYSNTDADVWNPNNMKFEIKVVESVN